MTRGDVEWEGVSCHHGGDSFPSTMAIEPNSPKEKNQMSNYYNKKRALAFLVGFLILGLALFGIVSPANATASKPQVVTTEFGHTGKTTTVAGKYGTSTGHDDGLWRWDEGYLFTATVGVPVEWYVHVDGNPTPHMGMKCVSTIKIPGYEGWTDTSAHQNEIQLVSGRNHVYDFTPSKAGEIKVTCWMGSECHYSLIKVVDPAKFAKAPQPKITGKAKVGKTLKAKVGKWSPKPGFTYKWYANGKAIKGATKASLKLKKAQKGKRISVEVTATKTGYATVAKTSKKTAKVK
jgi:hypothetical protein